MHVLCRTACDKMTDIRSVRQEENELFLVNTQEHVNIIKYREQKAQTRRRRPSLIWQAYWSCLFTEICHLDSNYYKMLLSELMNSNSVGLPKQATDT